MAHQAQADMALWLLNQISGFCSPKELRVDEIKERLRSALSDG